MTLFMRLVLGFTLLGATPALAADLGGKSHDVPRTAATSASFAAVAVSTHPDKDAYGFQYRKNSSAGAEADALRFCEERFAKVGIRNGRCHVESSTEYVVGVYCRNGGRLAGVGTGSTPVEAAADALNAVNGATARRCDFKVMRHGTLHKDEIERREWSASVYCRGRNFAATGSGSMDAMNSAFRYCGDSKVSDVTVRHLSKVN